MNGKHAGRALISGDNKKGRSKGRPVLNIKVNQLLDFGFLEFYVLLCNRIVLTLDHFLGHRAAVFLGNIEETGVCCALKLDLDRGGLCHCLNPVCQRK